MSARRCLRHRGVAARCGRSGRRCRRGRATPTLQTASTRSAGIGNLKRGCARAVFLTIPWTDSSAAFLTCTTCEPTGRAGLRRFACSMTMRSAIRCDVQKKLTLEYLNAGSSRIRFVCSIASCPAPGGSVLVMTRRRAWRSALPYVEVRSTCERHNTFPDDPIQRAAAGFWIGSTYTAPRESAPAISTLSKPMTTTR